MHLFNFRNEWKIQNEEMKIEEKKKENKDSNQQQQ